MADSPAAGRLRRPVPVSTLPRLQDVAAMAGVSPATASLALNGRRVGGEARRRVLEAAMKLHYVPRASAQALKTGRATTMGMWILNRPGGVELTEESSFFYPLIRGVLTGAQESGFQLSFNVLSAAPQDVRSLLAAEASRGSYAAFILVPQWQNDGTYVSAVRSCGVPTVTVNDPGRTANVSVVVDNEGGIEAALRALADRGHHTIGYLSGPSGHLDAERRLNAFYRYTAELGMRVRRPYVQRVDFTIDGGVKGMSELLAQIQNCRVGLPSALLAADDYVAAGALQVAAREGIRVPGQLSVVGYDDVDVARATSPRLTTVHQPLFETGRAAADAAIALANGHSVPSVIELAPELVIRESVTPP